MPTDPDAASTAPAPAAPAPADAPSRPDALARTAHAALLALPGALTLYLALDAGGYFPDSVALALVVALQAVAARVLLADAPAAGFGRFVMVPVVALGVLTVLAVASQAWSDAPARALLEGQRALLYLVVLVLFASLGRRTSDLRWMARGVALAMVAVCVVALAPRLFPERWSVPEQIFDERLGWPLTYWNALGLVAGIAAVLCLHFASSRAEAVATRAAAAAALPLLGVVLYLTLSRGVLLATAIGLGVYVVIAFSQGLLATVAAAAVPTYIAVRTAYDAELLVETERTTAAALAQADDLAQTLALCILIVAALRLALAWASRFAPPAWSTDRARRTTARVGVASTLLVAVVVSLAVGLPGRVETAADEFLDSNSPGASDPADVRERLSSGRSGRLEHWEVAFDIFEDEPLRGTGAGTFSPQWALRTDHSDAFISDAHSLYLEVLVEYGVVGLALLLAVLGTILFAFARQLRRPDRGIYAALFAAGVLWCAHAGIDWDWEMPATVVWLFALGGAAAGRRRGRSRQEESSSFPRIAVALGVLVVALTPYLAYRSESYLQQAIDRFYANDCAGAREAALDSIDHLGSRPEPYEIIGFCAAIRGEAERGLPAMREAVEQDPRGWEAHLALALVQAQAGEDPRAAARAAQERYPNNEIVRTAAARLLAAPPDRWPAVGTEQQNAVLADEGLSITAR
ncbi:MAG TPA: O-antigen ligase family protein [Solirubrobacteraceae bacterium]|nr:O-antigen ligase family protein [Solirubrobacteraceae bacterium]